MKKEKVKSFNQDNHLMKDEPGVCNALVMMWFKPGDNMTMFGDELIDVARFYRKARVTPESGEQFGVYFKQKQLFQLVSPDQNNQLDVIRGWPCTKFFIACTEYDKSDEGHAIGMIDEGQGNFRGFDPNKGFYKISEDVDYSWLKSRVNAARTKQTWFDFTVYGFE